MTYLKCYVDWNVCDMNNSRPLWCKMFIRAYDNVWCHDLIWGDMWIGTNDKWWCHDQIYSAMWIGNYVTGNFLDKFEVVFGLEQMIEDDVMT
jgi:hypothetical protein